MRNFDRARIIALNLLQGENPPGEADVRKTAEIAVQAVKAQAPDSEVDLDSLVRELEANLNVVVGAVATLTDDNTDHLPWLASMIRRFCLCLGLRSRDHPQRSRRRTSRLGLAREPRLASGAWPGHRTGRSS